MKEFCAQKIDFFFLGIYEKAATQCPGGVAGSSFLSLCLSWLLTYKNRSAAWIERSHWKVYLSPEEVT